MAIKDKDIRVISTWRRGKNMKEASGSRRCGSSLCVFWAWGRSVVIVVFFLFFILLVSSSPEPGKNGRGKGLMTGCDEFFFFLFLVPPFLVRSRFVCVVPMSATGKGRRRSVWNTAKANEEKAALPSWPTDWAKAERKQSLSEESSSDWRSRRIWPI